MRFTSLLIPYWTLGITFILDMYSSLDHGNEWCAREPTKDVIFCFDKHSGWVNCFLKMPSHFSYHEMAGMVVIVSLIGVMVSGTSNSIPLTQMRV